MIFTSFVAAGCYCYLNVLKKLNYNGWSQKFAQELEVNFRKLTHFFSLFSADRSKLIHLNLLDLFAKNGEHR